MEEKKFTGKVYEKTIYFARDLDGKGHFYDLDPISNVNRTEGEIDIVQLLSNVYGDSSNQNPIMLQISGLPMQRSSEFRSKHIRDVHRRTINKHFEDLDGNVVDIQDDLDAHNNRYPLVGNVLDDNGYIIVRRNYSLDGDCADDDTAHSLIMVSNTKSYIEFLQRKEDAMQKVLAEQEKRLSEKEGPAAAQNAGTGEGTAEQTTGEKNPEPKPEPEKSSVLSSVLHRGMH